MFEFLSCIKNSYIRYFHSIEIQNSFFYVYLCSMWSYFKSVCTSINLHVCSLFCYYRFYEYTIESHNFFYLYINITLQVHLPVLLNSWALREFWTWVGLLCSGILYVLFLHMGGLMQIFLGSHFSQEAREGYSFHMEEQKSLLTLPLSVLLWAVYRLLQEILCSLLLKREH